MLLGCQKYVLTRNVVTATSPLFLKRNSCHIQLPCGYACVLLLTFNTVHVKFLQLQLQTIETN